MSIGNLLKVQQIAIIENFFWIFCTFIIFIFLLIILLSLYALYHWTKRYLMFPTGLVGFI